AEEDLLGFNGRALAALEQRRQLVAHLSPEGPEPATQQVAHVVLEDQLVEDHAVELELLLQHRPHLPRASRDDREAGIALGVELADQRRGPRNRALLVRLLEGRADELPEGVEVGL